MDTQSCLNSLPTELLISILSQLPTTSLLPLITVSHRFYSVALRILKQRLNHATSRPDHRLMLECYNPAERLYAPYHYCNYLYTDSFVGVEAEAEGGVVVDQQQQPPSPKPAQYGGLRGIYSHFRPVEQEDTQPRRARHPRSRQRQSNGAGGGDPAQAAATAAAPERSVPQQQQPPEAAEERPSIDVYLDEDESFSQLCTITNLVRISPKPGLFRSHVNVSDGVIRVWRDWLAAQASGSGQGQDDAILWADAARDVGVRFRVAEKDTPGQQQPVLVASDEQLPVAYRLEFEELVVRSSTLLAMMEEAEVKEVAAEGKAIVLAL